MVYDIELTDQKPYQLILVFLYSKSIGMVYDIELTDQKVVNNDICFRNFIIERKGK